MFYNSYYLLDPRNNHLLDPLTIGDQVAYKCQILELGLTIGSQEYTNSKVLNPKCLGPLRSKGAMKFFNR